MRRRLFCPLLAAAVLATALGGVATPASAAIRIVISDGVNLANDKVFYSQVTGAESTFASFFVASGFDGYEVVIVGTTSNYSGNANEGTLTQSVTVSDTGGGALTSLRVSTAIIPNLGFATGQVTGATATTVLAQSSLLFTLPSSQFLQVSSIINTTGELDAGATAQLDTVVNGGTTTSSTPIDGSQNTTLGTALGLPGYTLASTIIVTGLSPGVASLQLTGISSVSTLTPEPATMLVWGLGALGLVCAARRRKMNPTAT